jgi:hypothetical protein
MADAENTKLGKWVSPTVFNALLADYNHHARLIWGRTLIILILQAAGLAGAWTIAGIWGGLALILTALITLILYLLNTRSDLHLMDRARHLDRIAENLQADVVDITGRFRTVLDDDGQFTGRRLVHAMIVGLLILDAILATLTFVGTFGPIATGTP